MRVVGDHKGVSPEWDVGGLLLQAVATWVIAVCSVHQGH